MYLSSPSKQLEFSESLNRSNLVLCYLFTLMASLLLHAKSLQSCLTLCDPMDCGPPGSLSIGYSRQEYWSGLLCPPPGYLPDPGIKPRSLMSLALAGRFLTTNTTCHIFIFPSHLRGETVFGGWGEAVGGQNVRKVWLFTTSNPSPGWVGKWLVEAGELWKVPGLRGPASVTASMPLALSPTLLYRTGYNTSLPLSPS